MTSLRRKNVRLYLDTADRVAAEQLLATGDARWASSGAPLVRNFPRDFRALRNPRTGGLIAIDRKSTRLNSSHRP